MHVLFLQKVTKETKGQRRREQKSAKDAKDNSDFYRHDHNRKRRGNASIDMIALPLLWFPSCAFFALFAVKDFSSA